MTAVCVCKTLRQRSSQYNSRFYWYCDIRSYSQLRTWKKSFLLGVLGVSSGFMCFSIGAYNCFWVFFCFCFASYCITCDYGSRINLDFFLICLNCNLMDVESDIGTIFKSAWRFNEVKIFCDVWWRFYFLITLLEVPWT